MTTHLTSSPSLTMIVAMDKQGAIGRNNQLLCHLPADLRYFKQKTVGNTIVMGRRTFESLPNGALPNRTNIVLTANRDYRAEGAFVLHSAQEVLSMLSSAQELFVIGGGQLYSLFMSYANKLYVTQIDHAFDDADTFFPSIDSREWQLIAREEHAADEKNRYPYAFCTYVRR